MSPAWPSAGCWSRSATAEPDVDGVAQGNEHGGAIGQHGVAAHPLGALGEDQLRFVESWADDWRGAEMKAAISQTIFTAMATTHGGRREVAAAEPSVRLLDVATVGAICESWS